MPKAEALGKARSTHYDQGEPEIIQQEMLEGQYSNTTQVAVGDTLSNNGSVIRLLHIQEGGMLHRKAKKNLKRQALLGFPT